MVAKSEKNDHQIIFNKKFLDFESFRFVKTYEEEMYFAFGLNQNLEKNAN